MRRSGLDIAVRLIAAELLYLIIFQVLGNLYPLKQLDTVYYANINALFLAALLIWANLLKSTVNRYLILMMALWITVLFTSSFIGLFSPSFSPEFNYNYYIAISIFSAGLLLFIALYLFFYAIRPHVKDSIHSLHALVLTVIITLVVYFRPLFTMMDTEGYEVLFQCNYYMNLVTFSFMVVFWQQHASNRLLLSEYLSNVLSIFTVIIALEIFHTFSSMNDLILHYFGQYFNFILNMLLLSTLFVRLRYLHSPDSVQNEYYIKNYNILHGFINKPRSGLFYAIYTGMNRTILIASMVGLVLLGLSLFLINHFQVFIKLNILILILGLIISFIVAITSWINRWENTMGFFFREKKKN
jgi:hypothetical protein